MRTEYQTNESPTVSYNPPTEVYTPPQVVWRAPDKPPPPVRAMVARQVPVVVRQVPTILPPVRQQPAVPATPRQWQLPHITPFWFVTGWATAILLMGIRMGVYELGLAASLGYMVVAVWRRWV